jgi:TAG lipase/steryl ester hydrolase/phospholipase A2/LPA acyltransferase
MRDLLGDITFQEAYNRTRRVLNIPVSSATLFEIPRLLNYVTAPNVIVWSAVATSCSVPLIFEAPQLLTKDPKTGELVPWDPSTRWIDGSVDNDLPIMRLAEMFNVNHFIVSQVNPHVVPFLAKEDNNPDAKQSASAFAAGPGWLNTLTDLAKDELLHRMHVLSEMGVFPNYMTKARSILSQQYSGDINIFPEISYTQFPLVLTNPTQEFMAQALLAGERATWPVMSRVRNHCTIELALDNTIKQLRERSVFSQSSDSRRLTSHMSDRSLQRYNRAQRLYHTQAALTPLEANLRLPIRSSSAKPAEARSNTGQPIDPPLQPLETITISPIKHTDITSGDSEGSNDQAVHSDSDTAVLSPHSDESALDPVPRGSLLPSLWPVTRQLFSSPSPSSSLDNPITRNLELTTVAPAIPSLDDLETDMLSAIQQQSLLTDDVDDEMMGSELLMKETHHSNIVPLPKSPKLTRTSSVEFDISGTKRMMLRRKQSSNNVSLKSLTVNDDAEPLNQQPNTE